MRSERPALLLRLPFVRLLHSVVDTATHMNRLFWTESLRLGLNAGSSGEFAEPRVDQAPFDEDEPEGYEHEQVCERDGYAAFLEVEES